MAASGHTVGGYNCELFLSPVQEQLKCGLCKQVARNPHLTGCCGEHFCKLCIEQVIQDKKQCPSCEEAEFSIYPDKRDHRNILALKVRCALKDRGCDWNGILEQLDSHLDGNSDNCQYIDVTCPNKCEQQIQKCDLPTHLANECTKRNFVCQYCNFTATYEVVCNDHWPQCPFYPVPCPNGCEILAIERGDLDAHLMLCSLEVVECNYSYAGCNVKLVREEMEKHLADNLQRHMLMMNKALQEKIEEKERKIEQLEARLEEKDRQIQEVKEEKDRQIQELREEKARETQERERQIQELQDENNRKMREQVREREQQLKKLREDKDNQVQEQVQEREQKIQELREDNDRKIQEQAQERERQIKELRDENDRKIKELQETMKEEQGKQIQETLAKVAQVEAQLVAHFQEYWSRFGIAQFTMNGFQELKGRDTYWHSPPLYTHPDGYKIGIRVYPNGNGVSTGTHVALCMCTAIGEFDDQLKWPAECTITLQLLNQHRDQDHVTVSQRFQWNKPRYTVLSYFGNFNNWKFIAHEDLDWNIAKKNSVLEERHSLVQD